MRDAPTRARRSERPGTRKTATQASPEQHNAATTCAALKRASDATAKESGSDV
jgi:hypothetical protein